jgi:hypothetical protein
MGFIFFAIVDLVGEIVLFFAKAHAMTLAKTYAKKNLL